MLLGIIKYILLLLLLAALYVLVGAIVPALVHPRIRPETAEKFAKTPFRGAAEQGERAAVLSDNQRALAERIRLISRAQRSVILSTFEFRSDTAGKQVLSALLEAADRGVRVRVLADGAPALRSMEGDPCFYALSAHPNAEIRLYNPIRPWLPWRLMGRMHDKYLIADRTAYILGGRNTYDFFLGEPRKGPRNHDWDVLVCAQSSADSLEQLLDYFHAVWDGGSCAVFHNDPGLARRRDVARAAAELRKIHGEMRASHPDWFEAVDYGAVTQPVFSIRLLSNPTTLYAKEPVVCYSVTELMAQGEREVRLHTPYIICNGWMMERLSMVCRRVPSVRLLTNSAANNGNPFGVMDYQGRRKKLLGLGLEILEYDGGISYHGKCVTVDDRLSVVGSFNFDMRSAYLDTELMLVIDSPAFSRSLREKMEGYEAASMRLSAGREPVIPEGHVPRELSAGRRRKLGLMRAFLGWARFLM